MFGGLASETTFHSGLGLLTFGFVPWMGEAMTGGLARRPFFRVLVGPKGLPAIVGAVVSEGGIV